MKVMGVDPSLRNTGWQVLEVPDDLPAEAKQHKHFKKLAGGTIVEDDASIPDHVRHFRTTAKLHELVTQHKPDLFSIEIPVQVGMSRSTTGMVAYTLSIMPYHQIGRAVSNQTYHKPEWVITFRPERLQALMHNKRSTKDKETVDLYKSLTGFTGRITVHESDAFFLAYFGYRFLKTSLTREWPTEILSDKEMSVYRTADKKDKKTGLIVNTSMFNSPGEAWWRNENTQS